MIDHLIATRDWFCATPFMLPAVFLISFTALIKLLDLWTQYRFRPETIDDKS